MFQTKTGVKLEGRVLVNYFRTLINMFFKILPIWENGEDTIGIYMRSLQTELLGCKELICAIRDDSLFLSLLSILQFLIDHPEMPVQSVKREVFRAISICNKLSARYSVLCEEEK